MRYDEQQQTKLSLQSSVLPHDHQSAPNQYFSRFLGLKLHPLNEN